MMIRRDRVTIRVIIWTLLKCDVDRVGWALTENKPTPPSRRPESKWFH